MPRADTSTRPFEIFSRFLSKLRDHLCLFPSFLIHTTPLILNAIPPNSITLKYSNFHTQLDSPFSTNANSSRNLNHTPTELPLQYTLLSLRLSGINLPNYIPSLTVINLSDTIQKHDSYLHSTDISLPYSPSTPNISSLTPLTRWYRVSPWNPEFFPFIHFTHFFGFLIFENTSPRFPVSSLSSSFYWQWRPFLTTATPIL